MSTDALLPLLRTLNQSMLTLAAVGAALRLQLEGRAAGAQVAPALAAVLEQSGAPALDAMTPKEQQEALGLARTFFIEASDLLNDPARPPGWCFDDPAILQGIGTSSASMVGRMAGLADGRPWFAAALGGPGTMLDIGTGVGGIALAAAAAWPGLDVVGIDRWAPSLAIAETNRATHPCGARVSLRLQGVEEIGLGDAGAYRLAWLPTLFIAGPAITQAMPYLLEALVPGGAIVLGVMPAPTDPLAAALWRLRTVRNGGHCCSCEEMAALLHITGFTDVEIPAGQTGMHFVLARRP